MREGKIESLPKWAQVKIGTLERAVRYHRRQEDLRETGETEVFVQAGYQEDDIPLRPGSGILFKLENDEIIVRVKEERGQPELYLMARGGGNIAFLSGVNNTGYVRVV